MKTIMIISFFHWVSSCSLGELCGNLPNGPDKVIELPDAQSCKTMADAINKDQPQYTGTMFAKCYP